MPNELIALPARHLAAERSSQGPGPWRAACASPLKRPERLVFLDCLNLAAAILTNATSNGGCLRLARNNATSTSVHEHMLQIWMVTSSAVRANPTCQVNVLAAQSACKRV